MSPGRLVLTTDADAVETGIAAAAALAGMMRSEYNRLVFAAANGFVFAARVLLACCNALNGDGAPLRALVVRVMRLCYGACTHHG